MFCVGEIGMFKIEILSQRGFQDTKIKLLAIYMKPRCITFPELVEANYYYLETILQYDFMQCNVALHIGVSQRATNCLKCVLVKTPLG